MTVRGSQNDLREQKLAVHEAVCAERWKQASDLLSRIEMVLGAIVLLPLVGDGCARIRVARYRTPRAL
mgnify:CR=1 FL=1